MGRPVEYDIAIIGLGKLGKALLARLVETQALQRSEVVGAHHMPAVAIQLEESLGIRVVDSDSAAAEKARVVFLSVRPEHFTAVATDISPVLRNDQEVVSAIAGVSLNRLRGELPTVGRIFRAYPSLLGITGTPGCTFFCAERCSEPGVSTPVAKVIGAVGHVLEVPEVALEVSGVFAGCGPAFVARFAMEWQAVAAGHGIEAATARQIVSGMLQGIGAALGEGGMTLEGIVDQIATPGGGTECGIRTMEAEGLRDMLKRVAERCLEKVRRIDSEHGAR